MLKYRNFIITYKNEKNRKTRKGELRERKHEIKETESKNSIKIKSSKITSSE